MAAVLNRRAIITVMSRATHRSHESPRLDASEKVACSCGGTCGCALGREHSTTETARSLIVFANVCAAAGCGGSLYWADHLRMHVLTKGLDGAENNSIADVLVGLV